MRHDKALAALPVKTELKDGDPYVDEPVLKEVTLLCGKEPIKHQQLSHYRRIPLRWMKPGPNGKLVPR